MGLGINMGGGDGGEFLPLMAYNAKAGRLKLTQRVEGPTGWESQEEDVSFKQPVFVMDLANVQVGWLLFKKGMAPIKALAPIGQPIPAQPRGDYGVDERGKGIQPKQGFVMRVLDANRVVREFSSNAGAVLGSVDDLHTRYVAAPEAAQGMLPVVQFQGATELKSKHGSNFAPVFSIVKWVPRPAELAGSAPAPAAPPPVHVAAAAVTAAVAADPLPF